MASRSAKYAQRGKKGYEIERDLPYAEKREHYLGQNLLARSLHEQTYDHNPGFRLFIEEAAS
jgi:hypothetical protein